MDRKILYVESEIDSTKALKNKQMVSFHKQPRICLNADVLAKTGIYAGMYAKYYAIDYDNRLITLLIKRNKPIESKSQWYKITNPQIGNHKYCYIRTTELLHNQRFGIVLKGAFEYHTQKLYDNSYRMNKRLTAILLYIHF